MREPPSLDSPPVWQLIRWVREPLAVLDDCAARFGDTFRLQFPDLPTLVVLRNPDDIRTVFSSGPDDMHAGAANVILKPFLGSHSLLLLDGSEHLRQRKLLLPPFHGERMQAYGDDMLEITQDSMDRWPAAKPFPIHRPMQQITLNVIMRTVFGVRPGDRAMDMTPIVTEVLDRAAWMPLFLPVMQKDLGPWSPWGRHLRIAKRSEKLLFDEIDRRRAAGTAGRNDVLSMLLDARDEGGQAMTNEELRDQLFTLLSAGHETTATALSWALRWILADAPLYRRLRDEVRSVPMRPDAIAQLELLDATVREALRLIPVIIMVGRVLCKPYTLGGYELAAGQAVLPSIYLAQRRPESYPDPTRFNPDRYFRNKLSPYEWLPFGGGIRRCIGMAFAIYEMKMVLASVLRRTVLRMAPGPEVVPIRRAITMSPSRGMPIVMDSVEKREPIARSVGAAA